MKKTCLIFSVYCLMFGGTCFAQTMVLHDDRSKDSAISRSGANMPRFYSMILGVGMSASSDQAGGRIKYNSIGDLVIGIREKYKISSMYSMGFDMLLNYNFYKLKQESGKRVPDSITHHVERIDVYTVGLTYYNRFNFDPGRGNYLGNYLDIGIVGSWIAGLQHLMKDTIKTLQSDLPYSNTFKYDVFVRLGRNHVALYAHYRLSDLFKSSYDYPELPRLMAGIEFGIFR